MMMSTVPVTLTSSDGTPTGHLVTQSYFIFQKPCDSRMMAPMAYVNLLSNKTVSHRLLCFQNLRKTLVEMELYYFLSHVTLT